MGRRGNKDKDSAPERKRGRAAIFAARLELDRPAPPSPAAVEEDDTTLSIEVAPAPAAAEAAPGGWQNVLGLLDEVQDALARSGKALQVQVEAMAAERALRRRLQELGDALARRASADDNLQLPEDLTRMVEETEQLRLSAGAARDAARSSEQDTVREPLSPPEST
ncbi:MAG: hypothetical protein AB2A00_16585 [Myxococcota bacterium]